MKPTTRLLFPIVLFAVIPCMAAPAAGEGDAIVHPDRASKLVRIRISGDRVKQRVYAEGGIVVRDPDHRTTVWKRRFDPGVYFVSENASPGKRPIYRVQIASFTSEDLALKKKAEIEALLPSEKVILAYHPDRHAWRVRVGEVRTREETTPLVQRLGEEGYTELWVTEESEKVTDRRRIRMVDDRWNNFLTSYNRLLIETARPGARLRIGDASYRGTMEAMIDSAGYLRIINEVDLEQYLRGVVPNEMGPGIYPELEALKAQAVAARTYIVANLGQFSEEDFDICDTPSCQVYGGASTEHSMTDRALEETRGIVLTWDGVPINAMYTSTCGGHTEDGHEVFPEEKGAYLKGVTCYPEADAAGYVISAGNWIEPVTLEDGTSINEEIHLLQQLGVVDAAALDRSYLLTFCGRDEAVRWITAALATIGKKPSSIPPGGDPLMLQDLVTYFARSLGWQERMRLALNDKDLPYLLAFRDWEEIPESARRPYATLMREGILDPFPDNSLRPRHEPSRGLVLRVIYRVLEYYGAVERQRGSYRGFNNGHILLEVDGEVNSFTLAPFAALFRSFHDVPYATRSLPLTLGDRILYRQAADSTIGYMKLMVRDNGVSDDRYSSLYRWEERVTREELEKRIRARVRIGSLIDIEPTRRGVSGRVAELKVRGSRGIFYLRGFRIRRALGIRETMFTVDRTRGPDGHVESYIFSGKGWGHGVGLCQVGAYGMALRGKGYEEILQHYYGGADLMRWDGTLRQ